MRKGVAVLVTTGVLVGGAPAASSTASDSPIAHFDTQVSANVRAIYRHGLALGNRPDVFAKVGDSNTATGPFLRDLGCGTGRFAPHPELAATVRFFSRRELPRGYIPFLTQPAACHRSNSFVRIGYSAHPGWVVASLVAPYPHPIFATKVNGHYILGQHAGQIVTLEGRPQSRCPDKVNQALGCELHVLKPSVALIMIGTNDLPSTPLADYLRSLHTVVKETIKAGTIPVLSTIPPRANPRVASFNAAIVKLADHEHVPLWDFWRSLNRRGTVSHGLDVSGVHLSVYKNNPGDLSGPALRYGMNLRNLQALEVLDFIRRRVLKTT